MAEAGPTPVLRSCYQTPADWVAVHVLEFLDRFVVVPHVEVIIAALPESCVFGALKFPGYLLFQNLQDRGKLKIARFAYQKMDMFGHDDISGDNEAVALPHLLQFLLEGAVSGPFSEQGLSLVTTEGRKVEVARVLIAD
jgi:hypothetical protein